MKSYIKILLLCGFFQINSVHGVFIDETQVYEPRFGENAEFLGIFNKKNEELKHKKTSLIFTIYKDICQFPNQEEALKQYYYYLEKWKEEIEKGDFHMVILYKDFLMPSVYVNKDIIKFDTKWIEEAQIKSDVTREEALNKNTIYIHIAKMFFDKNYTDNCINASRYFLNPNLEKMEPQRKKYYDEYGSLYVTRFYNNCLFHPLIINKDLSSYLLRYIDELTAKDQFPLISFLSKNLIYKQKALYDKENYIINSGECTINLGDRLVLDKYAVNKLIKYNIINSFGGNDNFISLRKAFYDDFENQIFLLMAGVLTKILDINKIDVSFFKYNSEFKHCCFTIDNDLILDQNGSEFDRMHEFIKYFDEVCKVCQYSISYLHNIKKMLLYIKDFDKNPEAEKIGFLKADQIKKLSCIFHNSENHKKHKTLSTCIRDHLCFINMRDRHVQEFRQKAKIKNKIIDAKNNIIDAYKMEMLDYTIGLLNDMSLYYGKRYDLLDKSFPIERKLYHLKLLTFN